LSGALAPGFPSRAEPGAPLNQNSRSLETAIRAGRCALIGLGACVSIVLALPSAASAEAPDLSGAVQLSDERTFTRWAHSEQRAPIRALPIPNSWPITSLRYATEDGFPKVYPLLRRWTDPEGRTWLEVRIPGRPNGRIGWVEASALGPEHLVDTRLIVNRRHLSAALYRSGRRIWRSRIGIGKRDTPTPAGRFWIRELIKAEDPSGLYGPWAFGTSAYSRLSDWPRGGVIGIHGTNEPDLIPGRPSHGCIRVPNRAIRRLARLMPIGTPVWIR